MENSSEPKFVSDLKLYVEFPRFNINPAKLFQLFLEQNNELNALRREIHQLTQENEKLLNHFTCWYIGKSKDSLSVVNPRKPKPKQLNTQQTHYEEEAKPQIQPVKNQNQVASTQTDTSGSLNHNNVAPSPAANLTIRVEIVTKTNTSTESVCPAEEVIVKSYQLLQSPSHPQFQQLTAVQKPITNAVENKASETNANGVESKTNSKQNKALREEIKNRETMDTRTVSKNMENPNRDHLPASADNILTGNSNETTINAQTTSEKFPPLRNLIAEFQNAKNNRSAIQNMTETKRGAVYRNRSQKSKTDFQKALNEMRETRFPTIPKKYSNPNPRDTEVEVKREDVHKTSVDSTPSQINCVVDANSRTVLMEGPVQVCQKRKKTLKDIFTRSKPQSQSSKVLETETVAIPVPPATTVKLESAWAKNRNKRNCGNSTQVQGTSTSGTTENEKVNCESVKGFLSTDQPGNQIPKFQKTFASPVSTPSAPPYRSSRIRQPRN